MNPDLEVWITRLPKYELDCTGSGSATAIFDHLHDDSFAVHPTFPAVLVREIAAVEKQTAGQVSARVLRANPAVSWPQPPWRRLTEGTHVSLLRSGTTWFDIDGFGEESFSTNDSWRIPTDVGHTLLEASSDFELLEIEFRGAQGETTTSPLPDEVLMLYGSYSYRPIASLGGSTPVADDGTQPLGAGNALSLKLHNHPPAGWAGCPWHLHDEGIQCGYLTTGSAHIEVEGVGLVEAKAGTFWLQQARSSAAHT